MPKNQISIIYQNFLDNIDFNSIPNEWKDIDLINFSKNIKLFDYQENALKNAIKLLYYYYNVVKKYQPNEKEKDNLERKLKFYEDIKIYDEKLLSSLYVSNKKNKSLFNKLSEYYKTETKGKYEIIPFYNFVNRAGFWMATGSGKTVIIIKLIEILNYLIELNLIPNNDILILTHRDDLIKQIKKHIEEYNNFHNKKIKVWDLKERPDVKIGRKIVYKDNINIFIYRSDLISDETKEKLINFEDFEDGGKWYIILDEAHRGDKEDSKRQLYYSIISRNGFLFNFSASFTDDWDIITTIYNFNLPEFINNGYGKQIYMSQQDLDVFSKKEKDYTNEEKKKIVLKSLLLLTLLKKVKESIDKKVSGLYHNPMLISLVNSVNVKDSDLEMFFRILVEIAKGNITDELFTEVKKEIIEELTENPKYLIGTGEVKINEEKIKNIEFNDILKYVFNSNTTGDIEVIKSSKNKEELVFQLKTSDKPFALIRIGDISTWLKEKLTNYIVRESFEEKSYFEYLNDENSTINILMGSRVFYEGWDSNRPNVMIFINIGKGDAKKFIIQSIGRGVRIEPIKGKRKRMIPLSMEDVNAKNLLSKLDVSEISLIETLFIFGTNKDNVKKILEGIKYEKRISGETIELNKNIEKIENIGGEVELLVPVYKEVAEKFDIKKLPAFNGDKKLIESFINWIGDDKVLYAYISSNYRIDSIDTLWRLKEYLKVGKFGESKDKYVKYQLKSLLSHINVIPKEFDKFESVEGKIIHFKKINVCLDFEEIEKLKKIIEKVKSYPKKKIEEKELEKLYGKIPPKDYMQKLMDIENKYTKKEDYKDLEIKYVAEHYYIPIIIAKDRKVDYIKHIIKEESERKFIEKLEKYLENNDNFFNHFDWWMFSKIDEHLDDVYIPYYDSENNKIREYKPDFIFWMKKGNDYYIIFIDPKSYKISDYERKLYGYKEIFEDNNGNVKVFKHKNYNVKVYSFFFTNDVNIAPSHKEYWIDNFDMLKEKILK